MWDGAFDIFTKDVQKGYYPLYWYGMFYDMVAEIKAENAIDNIYTLCGVDTDGKVLSVLTYYTKEEETAENKPISVDFSRAGKYEIYLLDETHTKTFDLAPNSCILIKET